CSQGKLLKKLFSNFPEDFGRSALRVRDDDRLAAVSAFPNRLVQRHLTEQARPELFGRDRSAALAEEGVALAGGIEEEAHVLGDPEERDIHLLKHDSALSRDVGGGGLRRGHDDGSVEGNCLDERELGVARSGRKIDEEKVEVVPGHVLHELL